ncbi:citrate lyase subunit beta / citryl-CoA lyase [Pseudoxanthobacter soli DSM 19599]|uniref:Citrate lyase subunit beta / citryl-CoA lyase n=1 Tax=Pseudoxanthobacter soli DSM 19599 TaxID=1123029 RepID=A0A1M7ZRM1_9HYPH|nr:aldolase/citrate lyase family protein [Pseudoxanthobacter soli]SHO67521.1 citrate lyase subunit beta / citryl-CoA lyase [Pseudoxanthobacter soli DSM 19599]
MTAPSLRSLALIRPDGTGALDAAVATGADAVVIDLAPFRDAALVDARTRTAALLAAMPRGGGAPLRFVRVHPIASGLVDGDLDAVIAAGPDGIVLPGADPDGIGRLALRIAVREARLGLDAGAVSIIAMVAEDAAGLLKLCGAQPAGRLAALGFCPARFRGAVGTPGRLANGREDAGAADLLARGLVAAAAAAAGVAALIDLTAETAAQSDNHATEELGALARRALRDGFTGGFASAPEGIAALNGVFRGEEAAVG